MKTHLGHAVPPLDYRPAMEIDYLGSAGTNRDWKLSFLPDDDVAHYVGRDRDGRFVFSCHRGECEAPKHLKNPPVWFVSASPCQAFVKRMPSEVGGA